MSKMVIDNECAAVRHVVRKKPKSAHRGYEVARVNGKNCVATDGAVLVEVACSEGNGNEGELLVPKEVMNAVRKLSGTAGGSFVEKVGDKLRVEGPGGSEEFDAPSDSVRFPAYSQLFSECATELFSLSVTALESIVKAAKEAGVSKLRVRRHENDAGDLVEFVGPPDERGFRSVTREDLKKEASCHGEGQAERRREAEG